MLLFEVEGFAGGLEFGGTGMVDGSAEVEEDKVLGRVLPFCVISTAVRSREEENEMRVEEGGGQYFCYLHEIYFLKVWNIAVEPKG